MDRRAWRAPVHGVAKSWTRLKRLSRAHGSEVDIEVAGPDVTHSDIFLICQGLCADDW